MKNWGFSMASDLYIFDGSSSASSFYCHSSPEMVSSDTTTTTATDLHFFCNHNNDPFSSSPLDVLQAAAITNNNNQNRVDEPCCFDQFAPSIFSSSPPSTQLENLSLTSQLQSQANSSFFANGFGDFSDLEIKTEQSYDSSSLSGYNNSNNNNNQCFFPRSYSDIENAAKYIERSFSSNSFDGKPEAFRFQTSLEALVEPVNLHNQALSSPESSFLNGQMRRVCSTGDLQNIRSNYASQRSFSSPLAAESSNAFMEETNFKVVRYSAEERKERISKYRAKRTQRNFNKTIKYACRKTLADNRPRIRGRFARNDEVGETPKTACSSARDEEEDDIWFVDGLHEEEDAFANSFGEPQFQYYGCF